MIHETVLDRSIEDLVYTAADPWDRVRWGQRLARALGDVVQERRRQEEIGRTKRAAGIDWRSCADPQMDGGDSTRFLVLGEEVGEVANALLEHSYGTGPRIEIRNEIVQVAAVALAWLESIDAAAEARGDFGPAPAPR